MRNLSVQDLSGPHIETSALPPSETGPPQPLVDVNYARGSEDSLSKTYAQERNPHDITSFNDLGYVFGSWGFRDANDSNHCTTSAGWRPFHQPASSGVPTDTAQTSLDPITSVFCTWQAGTDTNTLPQLSPNTGEGQHGRSPIMQLASASASATNSHSRSNYIPPAELRPLFGPATSSQSYLGAAQTRKPVESLFCTSEAGIDMNALPQLTVDVDQGDHSQSSLMPPVALETAANNLDRYGLNAHSKVYPSSLAGQAMPGHTRGSLSSEAIFCTWEAGGGLEDHFRWDNTRDRVNPWPANSTPMGFDRRLAGIDSSNVYNA